MDYFFDNDRPIYIQIVESLKIEIISGKLKPGQRLPSVRDLAFATKVNPNTMQKALLELENEKLIYTERTNGKFVTKDEKLVQQMKNELANKNVKNYLKDMNDIGISFKESIKYLQELGGE